MAQQAQAPKQTQQQNAAPQASATKTLEQMTESELLEEVLSRSPVKRYKAIDEALQARVEQLEELLPQAMKGEAKRLIKRAMVTLARKADEYKEVTAASFVRCVLEAAELGLAIDGRLAHAVVFNNKHKDESGKEYWQKEVQLMVDYKGVKAVATRIGIIKDCWARLVYENDEIKIWEENGVSLYKHVPALVNRGGLKGVLSVILFPDRRVKHDWMDNADVDNVRSRSKSFQAGFGPWKTDDGEMRKKVGIRRILKLYAEDPALARVLELDDRDYQTIPLSEAPPAANLKEQVAKKMEEAKKRRGRPPAATEDKIEDKVEGKVDTPAPKQDTQPVSNDEPLMQDDDEPTLQDQGDSFEGNATVPADKNLTSAPAKESKPKAAKPAMDDGIA